jgi:hypothetical protein
LEGGGGWEDASEVDGWMGARSRESMSPGGDVIYEK